MKSLVGGTIGLLIPMVLLIGLTIGFLVRPFIEGRVVSASGADVHDDHDEQAPEGESHEDHLPLSFEAVQNLSLLIRPVELSNFTEYRRMPGEIVESPGLSSQKVAAAVRGKVLQLFAAPGVSVAPGEPLVELEIIDDQLMEAQLQLLELLTKLEITNAELARLAPLAASGGIAGNKRLELEYQQKQLQASLSRTRQELEMRGLSAEQIESIEDSTKAITTLTILAPSVGLSENSRDEPEATLATDVSRQQLEASLTVEEVLIEVGQNVERGEAVLSLAVHALLQACGHAFESEIDMVSQIASDNTPVAIEFGNAERGKIKPEYQIQYIAGHADGVTKTYRYFIPLENEVVHESKDSLGRVFRTWRYKVGQPIHVLVPIKRMGQQIVLPRAAVVQDGPSYFVFRELTPDHAEEGVYIEMEPVPVRTVVRNKDSVVIAQDGQLKVGDRIAINSAYQLLLALRAQQEGGGGHGHSHDH